jgi:hypothetical protein
MSAAMTISASVANAIAQIRQESLERFFQALLDSGLLPSSWFDAWSGNVSRDQLVTMLISGYGINFPHLQTLVMRERSVRNAGEVGTSEVNDYIFRLTVKHANENVPLVRLGCAPDVRIGAYVLSTLYPTTDVIALSSQDILRAVSIAALLPGGVNWGTLIALVSSGADDELVRSMFTDSPAAREPCLILTVTDG